MAAAITLIFALMARVLRGVNISGALAGGVACFLMFVFAGPGSFAALGALFLMTWLSTRFGYRTKHQLGVAERREGRNGWQISANLGVAALSAVAFGITGNGAWLTASRGRPRRSRHRHRRQRDRPDTQSDGASDHDLGNRSSRH